MLKLVESICYNYLFDKPVSVIVQIIREVVAETTRFVAESTSHTVLTSIKKREEKDWASTSLFGSFLEKLEKDKGYVSVKNPTQVDNPNQTFKIFEGKAFNEKIYILADISNILGSLSGRESSELEWVSQVTKDYNLHSRSKSPEVIRILVSKLQKRKVPWPVVLLPLPVVLIVPVIPINQPSTSNGDGSQTIINTLA